MIIEKKVQFLGVTNRKAKGTGNPFSLGRFSPEVGESFEFFLGEEVTGNPALLGKLSASSPDKPLACTIQVLVRPNGYAVSNTIVSVVV